MIVGVGCDIVKISRFKEKEVLISRILTKHELDQCKSYSAKRRLEYVAGRFAAKEAVCKSLPVLANLSDIEILNDTSGRPVCTIQGYTIYLSISHEKEYAIAYATCMEAV